jgi:lysophospholipase L1-like esterase
MDVHMGAEELFPAVKVPEGAAGAPSFIALGDSFTEGMNDDAVGGGYRGWADRLAPMLAGEHPGLRYANLAVRGRVMRQIAHEQVSDALDLLKASGGPGLVGLAGGGNDILRPTSNPDVVAEQFDVAVARLREAGCQVLMFTGFDPMVFPLLRLLRGKVAAYNMHLRAIADSRGCYVVDLWSMQFLREPRSWSADRLHLNSQAHHRVALRAAEVLGVPTAEDWRVPEAAAVSPAAAARAAWLAARRSDARWAWEYLAPWLNRRLHGASSGDGLLPKRPALDPVSPA